MAPKRRDHGGPNCSAQAGFLLLEVTLALIVGGVLVSAAGFTIVKAVQTASMTLNQTEISVRSRRALDDMESLLVSAGSSTLESSGYEKMFADVYDARAALDRDLSSNPGVFAWGLPLNEQGTGCIFFRIPVASGDTEPVQGGKKAGTTYKPEKSSYCLYLRPMQTGDRSYEMVHFDGLNKRVLCTNLEDASFRYADGLVTITLSLIVGEEDDGSLKVEEVERLVMIRLN